jgi:hypothetical protein
MKTPSGSARPAAKSKRNAKATSGASKPRKSAAAPEQSASRLIDERIRELRGWRGETLARMRALIREADPAITEEWKWSNPVWSHHGIVCTGESYAKVVKLTFAQGARVADPSRLFNSSLKGRRSTPPPSRRSSEPRWRRTAHRRRCPRPQPRRPHREPAAQRILRFPPSEGLTYP